MRTTLRIAQWLVCLSLLSRCQGTHASVANAATPTGTSALAAARKAPSQSESSGEKSFSNPSLSEPAGVSCATCHNPNNGFSDGRPSPTSEGAVAGRFGFRNSPSIIYASFTPPLTAAIAETGYAGGLFWDGRALSLQVQAGGPLLNPRDEQRQRGCRRGEDPSRELRCPIRTSVWRVHGHADDVREPRRRRRGLRDQCFYAPLHCEV